METMSTIQAAKSINASVNFLREHYRRGNLKLIPTMIRKRRVWRVPVKDFERFCKKFVVGNKRIGREMFRANKRSPYISKGYRYIWGPNHHRANCQGYVPEHIVVMETAIGRKIKKGEIVHHLNGKRADNRIENLFLFKNQSDHLRQGHQKQYALRQKLIHMLSSDSVDANELTTKQKAQYFDLLFSESKTEDVNNG